MDEETKNCLSEIFGLVAILIFWLIFLCLLILTFILTP